LIDTQLVALFVPGVTFYYINVYLKKKIMKKKESKITILIFYEL